MGTHSAKPTSKISRIFGWCCSEGKHIVIELPAGLAAIMAFEILIRPRIMGGHETEAAINIISHIPY